MSSLTFAGCSGVNTAGTVTGTVEEYMSQNKPRRLMGESEVQSDGLINKDTLFTACCCLFEAEEAALFFSAC